MNFFRFAFAFSIGCVTGSAQDKPLTIGWANTQWPPATNHVLSVTNRTANIYGQVWIDGITSQPGATPKLIAQLGMGPAGSNPLTNANWKWLDAAFNLDVGNNDEFLAALLPEMPGSFEYLYRYSVTGGSNWFYTDLKGPVANNQVPGQPGKLTVTSSDDKTAPSVPTGLVVAGTSPTEIKLAWSALNGDPTLYGYEILRGGSSGGPYTNLVRLTNTAFTDTNVQSGAAYYYVVRSVDQSFNRSAGSPEVSATATPSISVVLNVTVPASTAASTKQVYIAGTLAALNGGLPDWDPGILPLNRIDATRWAIILSAKEGTSFNYKYTLGSWDHVEKGKECDEISDRPFIFKSGDSHPPIITDIVLNWRNIAPCKD